MSKPGSDGGGTLGVTTTTAMSASPAASISKALAGSASRSYTRQPGVLGAQLLERQRDDDRGRGGEGAKRSVR